MPENKATIIVAGGKGLRMQTETPKQFIHIQGKPILMHTIDRFFRYDPQMQIILVIPLDHIKYWNELCAKHHFKTKHQVTIGGGTRFESVKNGLTTIEDATLIAVHDGVRPLVSIQTIERCFNAAKQTQTAVPVTECIESIRTINNNGSSAADRSKYRLVQTPQVFDSYILKEAYKQEFSPLFTDDASVVESYFAKVENHSVKQITLVEGNRENIKITTSFDLIIAEALLKNEY